MRMKRLFSLLLAVALLTAAGAFFPAALAADSAKGGVRPESVKVKGSGWVARGLTISLKASVSPAEASQSVVWKSSDEKIATVSSSGKVKGVSAGKATITASAKADKSVRKSFTVTVTQKAVSEVKITAPRTELNLDKKKTVKLTAEALPSDAAQAFTWKSSDSSVAKVSAKGKVTAVAPGSAKITATAADGSKVKASVTITVSGGGRTKYRALLIGEKTFLARDGYGRYVKDTALRNVGDVNNLASMLGRVTGPEGGKYKVTKKTDLTRDGIRAAIQNTFRDTTDDDVSLFFIATHGDSNHEGELIVSFLGGLNDADINAYMNEDCITFDTLAYWLKTYVRGEVIVILESCGAGSAIYAPGEENSAKKASAFSPESFASKAVGAFSTADPGLPKPSGEDAKSTGDLRQPKFYVLAAARHQELSWGTENGSTGNSFNYFTSWLVDGVGRKGSAPADKDRDGVVTLNEMFRYIRGVGDEYPFYDEFGRKYYQHVQRYPAGSAYRLFRVK